MPDLKYAGEWIPRELSEPIRQGDIFRWVRPPQDDPMCQHGVVITADCDLAHQKHRGLLSYCPIMSLPDFLKSFWLPDELTKQLRVHLEGVGQRISRLAKKHAPQFDRPIHVDVIPGWLARRGSDGVAQDLTLAVGSERASLVELLDLVREIQDAVASDDLARQLRTLAVAKVGLRGAGQAKIGTQQVRIWRDLRARIQQLPGDLFFLNELAKNEAGGFVVQLRRIAEVSQAVIAVDPARERSDTSIRAVRLSRLQTTFRYRLTQKLAAVFADIGLPVEHEDACSTTMKRLGSSLGCHEDSI